MTTEQQSIHAGAEERATQRVSWWIAGTFDDGEATCRRWEAMVTARWEAAREAIEEDTPGDEAIDHEVYTLAGELKDWLTEEELSEEVQTGLVGDLIGYMVACVDFTQLARDAIEEDHQQS